MDNHEIIITETPDGFVAAATSSPYFCFLAPTEAAVRERVVNAMAFYKHAHEHPVAAKAPPALQVTRLVPSRRLQTRELAVA